MAWDPYTLPIDFVIVRGLPTPGVATIQRAKRTVKVDEIGGYGVSGSVLVVHGRRLVPFDIVVRITTPEEWAEWENFKSVVLTMPPADLPVDWPVDPPVRSLDDRGARLPGRLPCPPWGGRSGAATTTSR